jgi:hypothetical protein
MKTLSTNWITEGLPDVEYKTYLLLAYLAEVRTSFAEHKIYPTFSELFRHYQNVLEVKSARENLKSAFPRALTSADWESFRLHYEPTHKDDDFFVIMDEIIAYSIPRMKEELDRGTELVQHISSNLRITQVGLHAPYVERGYFFLCAPPKIEARVYEYNLTRVHLPDGHYRALHASPISEIRLSYTNTFESVKTELLRTAGKGTAYATYLIESEVWVPWEESLLPVAKRCLVEFLARETAAEGNLP